MSANMHVAAKRVSFDQNLKLHRAFLIDQVRFSKIMVIII